MNDHTDSICRLAELGILVAIADGKFVQAEAAVIKITIAQRIQELRPSNEAKAEINRTLDRTLQKKHSKKKALRAAQKVCELIVAYDMDDAEEAALELALKVVAADGRLTNDEERILRVIENALCIDAEDGSRLRDLHLRLCHIDADTDEEFFEIDPIEPLEERRKLARKLYRTWSGRVVLQDLVIQRSARENVRRLGRLLARYDRDSSS
jgi:tellurite resistance protein